MIKIPLQQNSEKIAIQKLSQILFQLEIQGHISHLQAKDKSYATHKALVSFIVTGKHV